MDINEIIAMKSKTEAAVAELLTEFQKATSTEIESVGLKQFRSAGRTAVVHVAFDVKLPKYPISPPRDFQKVPFNITRERTGDTHSEDELGPVI